MHTRTPFSRLWWLLAALSLLLWACIALTPGTQTPPTPLPEALTVTALAQTLADWDDE